MLPILMVLRERVNLVLPKATTTETPQTIPQLSGQDGQKAPKAAMTWRKMPLRKTHDLVVLGNCVVGDCPELMTLGKHAELLNPYANAYRHPAKSLAPDPDEFAKALAAAETILAAVKNLIGSMWAPSVTFSKRTVDYDPLTTYKMHEAVARRL